jgi:hypothetical protein
VIAWRFPKREGAMKLFIAFLVFVWAICGLVGAWRLNKLDTDHWKVIARGPLTLAESFEDNPVSYPGP